MGQLSGNENRPRQLGNTGQIVLDTCDKGSCNCEEEEEKKVKEETKKVEVTQQQQQQPTSKVRNRVRGGLINRKPIRSKSKYANGKDFRKPKVETKVTGNWTLLYFNIIIQLWTIL